MDQSEASPGVAGIVKAIAAIAVVLIAGLAILLVLDVIPREAFTEYLSKSLLVAAIVGLGLVAISFIVRAGRKRD